MKKILILIFLLHALNALKAQVNDTIFLEINSTEELISSTKASEVTLYKYVDSTFKYSVLLPDSLEIIETGTERVFAGILPTPDNTENSISITSFYKAEFKSWDHFVKVFITGNKPGKTTLFSPDHVLYGFSSHDTPFNSGIRKRLFTISNQIVNAYEFALVETPSAYLWIQYSSTPNTYDHNIERFNRFLDSLQVFDRL